MGVCKSSQLLDFFCPVVLFPQNIFKLARNVDIKFVTCFRIQTLFYIKSSATMCDTCWLKFKFISPYYFNIIRRRGIFSDFMLRDTDKFQFFKSGSIKKTAIHA